MGLRDSEAASASVLASLSHIFLGAGLGTRGPKSSLPS